MVPHVFGDGEAPFLDLDWQEAFNCADHRSAHIRICLWCSIGALCSPQGVIGWPVDVLLCSYGLFLLCRGITLPLFACEDSGEGLSICCYVVIGVVRGCCLVVIAFWDS